MQVLNILLVLALLAAPVAWASEEVDDKDVLVLTKDNFDETLQKNEFVFVEFYAPWCGHCKHLAPEYAKVATHFKTEGSSVVIGKVDATVEQELGTKYGVRGYPTLKFFRSGNPIDYESGRTATDIISWISRKSGPPSRHLTTAEELDQFKAQAGTKIVAFLESDDAEEKETKKWLQAATSGKLEDFTLAHVTNAALFGTFKAPTAVIYKEGEEPIQFTAADEKFSKSNILTWAAAEGYPLLSELNQPVWQRSQTSQTPLVAVFVKQDDAAQLELARDLAKKFKGQALFSWSATGSLAERWGASGKVLPTAIVVKWVETNSKFSIFDEENEAAGLTLESGENFVKQALEGTYKSYKKSEPIPAKNDDPVKVVVGKNYDEIVNDKTKDVFVEFYAPWCGHCKKLAPIWDELGETFEDTPSVVIAKMDATANAAPENLEIRGFPTIIFFPADNKAGLPYNGERDLPNLKKFVLEHVSTKVNLDGEKKDEL